MRLISWNCSGGFAKKAAYLEPLAPDVIVIPESAPPEKLGTALASYEHVEWVGDRSPHGKGLLVASREPYTLSRVDAHNPAHRHVLPLRIDGPCALTLFAIWTLPDERRHYTGHLWRALQEYEALLTGDVLLVGDFNSNAMWDEKHRRAVSHSDIVGWLAERDIVSLYHEQTGEAQGEETTPTFCQRRRTLEGPYHLDYAFVSRSLVEAGVRLELLPAEEWASSGRSDHVPLHAMIHRE